VKALCSIGAGPHEALLDVSEPTFRAYAARHGYELITARAADPARPPAWAKVAMLRDVLERFELALWIDADAVIVDGRADIADDLAPDKQLGLVSHGDVPNTGVMVWRSGAFAQSLLAAMWANERRVHHPWWENAALLDALGCPVPSFNRLDRFRRRRSRPSSYLAGVHFLAPEWNWTYLARVPNPRIVHCVGVPVAQRLADMQAALAGRLA
jgi:glycosyl transferase family (putative galactosyltransferase)